MIDTDKYEGHINGYYFEGSNFELSHLTMYDSDDNILAVLKSNDKRLMGGSTFVSPTIELMVAAPKLLVEVNDLLAEIRQLNNIIGAFDDFMCNNWTPANVHSLWNELLTKEEEE